MEGGVLPTPWSFGVLVSNSAKGPGIESLWRQHFFGTKMELDLSYIDGSCAGLVSTVVWLSQINRQEQSDSIE